MAIDFNYNILIGLIVIIAAALVFILSLLVIILRAASNKRDRRVEEFNKKWEALILDYLVSDAPPKTLIQKLDGKDYRNFLTLLIKFLNSISGDEFSRLAALVENTCIYTFLSKELHSKKSSRVAEAAFYLGGCRLKIAAPALIEKLYDNRQTVFFNAALALAKINHHNAIELIIKNILRFAELGKDAILEIFLEFNIDACPLFRKILSETESDYARNMMIKTLGYHKDYASAPIIIKTLKSTANKELIITSLRALRNIEYTLSEEILALLSINSDPEIKLETIKSIERLKTKDAETVLFETLNDDNWGARFQAAESLYRISKSGKEIIEKLSITEDDKNLSLIAKIVISEHS